MNWIRLDAPALPENVALVRVAVGSLAAQLDFTLEEIEEIRVAVSEAFSNAVLHAYPKATREQPGIATVQARIDGQTLEVTVSDRGIGITDVGKAREVEYTTVDGRMGLGFVFMESFMDEVDVRTAPDSGTTVVMRKRCAPSQAQSGTGTGVAGQ